MSTYASSSPIAQIGKVVVTLTREGEGRCRAGQTCAVSVVRLFG